MCHQSMTISTSFFLVPCRVLDDLEMYEEQKPFTLVDFCALSHFLNHLVFKAIWTGLADASSFHGVGSSSANVGNNLFHAAHTLLLVGYFLFDFQ